MLKMIKWSTLLLLIAALLPISYAEKNVHASLQPVIWKGKKWEYLVEHPREVQYIHTIRFEELLDTVGQHGWELSNVTSENHFYAFYFKRQLLDHKLHAHRVRLSKVIIARLKKEKELQKRIDQAEEKAKQLAKQRKALHTKIVKEEKLRQDALKRKAQLEQTLKQAIVKSQLSPQEKQKELALETAIQQTTAEEIRDQTIEAKLKQKYGILTEEQKSEERSVKELKQEERLLENL